MSSDSEEYWIYYDDTNLKKLPDWTAVICTMLKTQFHPTALFYREIKKYDYIKMPECKIDDDKSLEWLKTCQKIDNDYLEMKRIEKLEAEKRKSGSQRAQSLARPSSTLTNLQKDEKVGNTGSKFITTDKENGGGLNSNFKSIPLTNNNTSNENNTRIKLS